jgi:hypothetical protein
MCQRFDRRFRVVGFDGTTLCSRDFALVERATEMKLRRAHGLKMRGRWPRDWRTRHRAEASK